MQPLTDEIRRPHGPLRLHLPDEAATLSLGAVLARVMTGLDVFPVMLLRGELGAGKTTLVRGLVGALPGGDRAEVASPSFNYMNSYPTRPECLHLDLYRLRHLGVDDELLEAMHETDKLVIVEWAEFCPERRYPQVRLQFEFARVPRGRLATIAACGDGAKQVLDHIRQRSFE